MSSDFQPFQPPYQAFGDRSKCTNYNWYHRHFHVPQYFQFSGKVQIFWLSFRFLLILHYGLPERLSTLFGSFSFFFFLLSISRSGRLAEIRWSVCISKSQISLFASFSKKDSGLWIYHMLLLLFLHILRVFHPTWRWWSSTGIYETASLLKFPQLFKADFSNSMVSLATSLSFVQVVLLFFLYYFFNPFWILPSATSTIHITVTC